jgi:Zn-dependent protease
LDPAILHALTWYLAFVISTACHEAAHAWSAWKLGDDTARRAGLATLNPLPHMQFAPFGMVVVPLLVLVLSQGQRMMGWGQAPYDLRWADQWPKRAALMALAGPATNVLIALLAALTLRSGRAAGWFVNGPGGVLGIAGDNPGWQTALASICSLLLLLNVSLAALNLIPLPPFDGAAVVMLLLPRDIARGYQQRILDPNAQHLGALVVFFLLGNVMWPWFFAAAVWLLHGAAG